MSDAQLREMGMSSHDLIRIRSLPREEQVEVIADFVIDRAFPIFRGSFLEPGSSD